MLQFFGQKILDMRDTSFQRKKLRREPMNVTKRQTFFCVLSFKQKQLDTTITNIFLVLFLFILYRQNIYIPQQAWKLEYRKIVVNLEDFSTIINVIL